MGRSSPTISDAGYKDLIKASGASETSELMAHSEVASIILNCFFTFTMFACAYLCDLARVDKPIGLDDVPFLIEIHQ
jgi:hypothetical protein